MRVVSFWVLVLLCSALGAGLSLGQDNAPDKTNTGAENDSGRGSSPVEQSGTATEPASASEPASTSDPLPTYLEELKRLAQDHLENNQDEGGSLAAPAARRVSGPISREAYAHYVGEADFKGQVESDSIQLTRPVIPRVIIRDREALNYLFDCCAYDEVHPDSLEFIEIYDFSRSGFSNGDLMVAHPSGHSYILDGLDVDFLDSAAGWDSRDQLRYRSFVRETGYMDALVGSLEPPADYDWNTPRPEMTPEQEEDQALRGIWGDLHRAVDRQYGRGALELYFSRDDSTTTVEFWGYDNGALDFQYLGTGEGQGHNDLLSVAVTDTVITAYRSYVDLLVVKDSRVDTVYVKDGP